jgi:hypothetical protein
MPSCIFHHKLTRLLLPFDSQMSKSNPPGATPESSRTLTSKLYHKKLFMQTFICKNFAQRAKKYAYAGT